MRHALLIILLVMPAAAQKAKVVATPAVTAPGAVTVGAAGPTDVAAAAADGSWLALCQARVDTDHDGSVDVKSTNWGLTGDQLAAYLVTGSGDGAAVDDIIANDPSKRRLVIERNKRLLLFQPPKPELDLTKLGATSAQFDPSGDHLVYRVNAGKVEHLRVRELATDHEIELDPGPGVIYSCSVEDGWVMVKMLAKKGQWAVQKPHKPRRCWVGTSSDVITEHGTPPIDTLIPIGGGTARVVPDLIHTPGTQLLRRTKDGALVTEGADGIMHELVPATCAGFVVASDPFVGSVVVACKSGQLVEYKAGAKPRSVGVSITPPTTDAGFDEGRFILDSGKDGNSVVIDLKLGTKRETGFFQNLEYAHGDLAIVQRGNVVIAIDGTHERVLGSVERYPTAIRTGTLLYLEPILVDLATGQAIGVPPSRSILRNGYEQDVVANVKAVSGDGRLLVGFGGGRYDLTPGPLEWTLPAAMPVDAAKATP